MHFFFSLPPGVWLGFEIPRSRDYTFGLFVLLLFLCCCGFVYKTLNLREGTYSQSHTIYHVKTEGKVSMGKR